MLPLSVVIITKNEEKNLARCLESVTWADQVLILDSGSQDRTVEIARKYNAEVFSEEWRGFGAQKARAALLAKNDWILSLDADECVTPDWMAEFKARAGQLDAQTAYAIPRRSYYWGQWIRHGGWWPDRQVRLFHRKFSNWDAAVIHEKVVATKYANFSAPLEHYVFRDVAHQIDTNNRYSGLLAQKDVAGGKRFRLWKLIVKPWFKFFENYFWKLGLLDGQAGFVIALNSAHSTFLRWVKIWEIERQNRTSQ